MPTVSFEINGRDYSVDCGEGQEAQILALVKTIDERARGLARKFDDVDSETLMMMTCILMAGDLDRARVKAAALERNAENLRTSAADEDKLAEFVSGLALKVKEISGSISDMLDME